MGKPRYLPGTGEKLKAISLRNNKKLAPKKVGGNKHTIETKMKVVNQWLLLGSLREAADATGVPYDTIRMWRGEPWWKEVENELRTSGNLKLDTKMSGIIEKSLDATLDRVEHGDFIYDQKSGEIRRKPAALRDIHRVAVDLLQKREMIRDAVEGRKETTQVAVAEQLKVLAAEFAKWTGAKPKVTELVEVEDAVYAVHEEREEGLQTGEREVQLETGSDCEEGSEECRPSGSDQGRGSEEG